MTNRNFWLGALVLGGLWASVMGFGMLGVSLGCRGEGHEASSSGATKTKGRQGRQDHMSGSHDHGGGQGHMAGAHDQMAKARVAPRAGERPPSIFDSPPPEGAKAYCPVMKKTFFISKSSPKTRYKGKWVYFCCSSCKGKFEANPEAYLAN